MVGTGRYTYFDKWHFSLCLRAAIEEEKLSIADFQRRYFPNAPVGTVYQWTSGTALPDIDNMQTLIDIYGYDMVTGEWLKFVFKKENKCHTRDTES